jgi:hypothetical protein
LAIVTLTKAKPNVECQPRDRSGSDSARPLGRVENPAHTEQESGSVIGEFGDLTFEANRVAYIEAMILDRVIPAMDGEPNRLEAAFMKLPRRTMNDLIATQGKLYEEFRQDAAIVLETLKRRYIS